MAVMTESAKRTALNWLKIGIERANRDKRRVSGAGEEAEILETLLAMIEERQSAHEPVGDASGSQTGTGSAYWTGPEK